MITRTDKIIFTFIENLLCVSQWVECIRFSLSCIEVIIYSQLHIPIICNGYILAISSALFIFPHADNNVRIIISYTLVSYIYIFFSTRFMCKLFIL